MPPSPAYGDKRQCLVARIVLLTLMLDICDEDVVLNDILGRVKDKLFLFDSVFDVAKMKD